MQCDDITLNEFEKTQQLDGHIVHSCPTSHADLVQYLQRRANPEYNFREDSCEQFLQSFIVTFCEVKLTDTVNDGLKFFATLIVAITVDRK